MFVAPAPSIPEVIESLPGEDVSAVLTVPLAEHEADENYLHWDKLRRLDPPGGISAKQWWLKLKLARAGEMRPLPLLDLNGEQFGFTLPDAVLGHLHHIDQRCNAGEAAADEIATSERLAGRRFLINAQMEEAIRSSQLEGASTSRQAAKEMLKSGREPRDRSERMIVNNYRALQFMRDEMGAELSPDLILELHRIVTENTLDDPTAAGRLQRPDEQRIAVFDRDGGEPIHRPPPAEQLPERMQLMCDFANQSDESRPFVHPVIRSILLHFWLAYDHPFVDGNGRTARILFFWSMRTRGYWLAEYLPISRFLREAPAQYARAFVEVETDGGDTTYFLVHQLQVVERAIDDLYSYVQRKVAEVQDTEWLIQGTDYLNGRQLALLTDAIRHADLTFSFESHARNHHISHETARGDLHQLARRGLLVQRRRGRKHIFEPAPDLVERLKESGA